MKMRENQAKSKHSLSWANVNMIQSELNILRFVEHFNDFGSIFEKTMNWTNLAANCIS